MNLNDIRLLIFISIYVLNLSSVQGQNSTTNNETTTSVTPLSTASLCPKGSINPPACNECAENYERKDNQCLAKINQAKPSSSTGRRLFFLFIGSLATMVLVLGMMLVYRRVIEPHRHGRRSVSNNPPSLSTDENPRGHRFQNLLQSIGFSNLGKRGRFNFFSISNNNPTAGGHLRATENSRSHLSENPDEALLFDDPYVDGGLSGGIHGSSANPYKSLTLSVT